MKIELFSTPLIIGNIDLNKFKLIAPELKNTWESNTLSTYGQENKMTKENYDYLMVTLASLLGQVIRGETTFKLQNIWENDYRENDFQENHIHTGSHFSFIIYVKGEKSNTVFFAPHKYLIECFYKQNEFPYSYQSECRPGQIVLFPSYLEHMVLKNTGSITYAGNIELTNYTDTKLHYNPNQEI